MDLVALSSWHKGMPLSLIEVQSAGVPVISTNEGVVREWAYTGRRISASEALKEGLVTKIF